MSEKKRLHAGFWIVVCLALFGTWVALNCRPFYFRYPPRIPSNSIEALKTSAYAVEMNWMNLYLPERWKPVYLHALPDTKIRPLAFWYWVPGLDKGSIRNLEEAQRVINLSVESITTKTAVLKVDTHDPTEFFDTVTGLPYYQAWYYDGEYWRLVIWDADFETVSSFASEYAKTAH